MFLKHLHPGRELRSAGGPRAIRESPIFGEPDTDIQSWVRALDAWESSDIAHVLPGHGPAVAKSYLRGVSGYFRDLTESLRQLKLENISVKEAQ